MFRVESDQVTDRISASLRMSIGQAFSLPEGTEIERVTRTHVRLRIPPATEGAGPRYMNIKVTEER